MIFGRPGSGKSTFANHLAAKKKLPLYHLDKYFYTSHWREMPETEFLAHLQSFVEQENWIIEGNCIHSLELRYAQTNLVLYFLLPRWLCLFRVIKRMITQDTTHLDDLAQGCRKSISLKLLYNLWFFEKRVNQQVTDLKAKYPQTPIIVVKTPQQAAKLLQQL